MKNLAAIFSALRIPLQNVYSPEEAKNILLLIVEKILNIEPKHFFLSKNRQCTNEEIESMSLIITRLLDHCPIQYALEEAWFYKFPFYVNPEVLIPRPETEELVDWVKYSYPTAPKNILDIGTGSGCIAISLKKIFPNTHVLAIENSESALKVAKKNAKTLNCSIDWIALDFLEEKSWPYMPTLDCIISNPPYIPMAEKKNLPKNVVLYEPREALFPKTDDALIFYKKMAKFGLRYLHPKGKIFVEMYEHYAQKTKAIFEDLGYACFIKKDMQGKERMLIAINNQ